MAEYDVGEAFLRLVPSLEGVATVIDREAAKWGVSSGQAYARAFNDEVRRRTNNTPLGPSDTDSTRQGTQSAGKFADAFKAKVTAALRALPDVQINADSSAADRKLADLRARLLALSNARVGVDIDEGAALAQIDRLKAELTELGAKSPSVSVRMDTAAAAAELAALRAEIEGVNRSAKDLGNTHASPNVSIDVGPALAAISVIKTALLALSAGAVITPLIGGAASLLGPLAAVGLGGAGVFAASLPGLDAVKDALSAQSAAHKAVGTSAGQSAAAQVSAANQVKSAELSLADTERRIANDRITSAESVKTAQQGVAAAQQSAAQQIAQANQQVTTAEQTLANAQRASLAAQQALTDARNAATRSLQDQAFAATDAGLQLEQDQLAVQQAQANLDAVNANSSSTALQKQQAALALKEAQQALVEQQVTLQRATDDNNKAQAAGVDGSKQVVSAQNGVTTANKAVSDATTALAAAQTAAAQARVQAQQKVQAAEKALADARRAQSQQEAQDASDLIRAQLAVQQAHIGAASSMSSSSAAAEKLAAAMAKLTPSQRQLLADTEKFKKTFSDWGKSLEPTVLPLFGEGLKIIGDLLPKLSPLIKAFADALGPILKSIDAAIKGPGFAKFIDTLTQMVGPAMKDIAGIGGNLAGVFAHIVEAFAPLSGVVLGGLKTLTGELNKATQSPALAQFVHLLVGLAPQILSTFSSVGGTIGAIVKALAPLAGPVLSVIKTLADALSRLVGDLAGPFQRMFTALAPIINQLIAKLLPPLTQFLTDIAGQVPALANAFSDVVQALLPLLPIIVDLLKVAIPVLDFLAPLAPYIVAVVVAIKAWEIVQAAINLLLEANPIGLVVAAIAALVAGIILAYQHSATFRAIVGQAFDEVKDLITNIWHKFLEPVFSAFATAFDAVGSAATTAFGAVKTAWGDVRDFLSKEWKDFATAAGKLWDSIASAIGTAFGAVKSTVSNIWTDVEKVFATGVNFVTQDILNPLIGILNDVLGVFGVHIGKISKITVGTSTSSSTNSAGGTSGGPVKHFALGGVLPGYSPGIDNVLIPQFHFSGGEGILVPEATRALGGRDGIQAINAMFSARVSPPNHFAGGGVLGGDVTGSTGTAVGGGDGGVLGSIGAAAGGVASDLAGAVNKVKDAIRRGLADAAIAALKVAEAPIKALLGTGGTPFAGKLATGVFNKLNESVFDFIRGHAKSVAVAGTGVAPTGNNVRDVWNALLSEGWGKVQAAGVMGNMQSESGFDPFIIQGGGHSMNPADAGGGGYGLVQWTPGAKLIPLLSGLAPSIASEVMALTRQLIGGSEQAAGRDLRAARTPGDAARVFGLEYERYSGGVQENRSSQAEAIYNQYAFDSGGYLPPGITTVFNGTGRPEPVFTAQQFDQMGNGVSSFEGNLYLDSGELLGVVRGQAHSVVDDRLGMAQRRARSGVPGGPLAQLAR